MKTGLVLALLGGQAFAALLTEFFRVESVPQLRDGWSQTGAPAEGDTVPMSIAIRHDGVNILKKRLAEISDPKHTDYGKHLSRQQIRGFRSPPKEKTDAVFNWLGENGIQDAVLRNDWIHFNATVKEAKSLFDAELGYYSYMGNTPVVRARSYGVPKGEIADAVQFVHPLANFLPPRDADEREHPREFRRAGSRLEERQASYNDEEPEDPAPDSETPVEESPCAISVTPECLKQLYNINYKIPEGESPALYGVAGFLEQFVFHEDTQIFLSEFAPEIPEEAHNITIELVNGGEDPQIRSRAGIEASLDVQYAIPLAYPSRFVYYSTGGRGVKLGQDGNPLPIERVDNEPYLEFAEHLLEKDDADLPHVIAISYADDEQGVPREYALKVCDLFAALTSRGVSIIGATGDGGARGVRFGNCLTNDGEYRKEMVASFPGTCPYVTAIGAVSQASPPEVASFSTGGFSIYFDRPPFQEGIVEPYIDAVNDSLGGLFNASGRAIPDISAVGTGFTIRYGGGPGSAVGTSASTPVIASMFSLINDARMRDGKSSLGWLNPMLYTEPVISILQDVVQGSSSGCTWDDGEAPGGWPALEGYDCGTGLGIPNDFEKLLDVFMNAASERDGKGSEKGGKDEDKEQPKEPKGPQKPDEPEKPEDPEQEDPEEKPEDKPEEDEEEEREEPGDDEGAQTGPSNKMVE